MGFTEGQEKAYSYMKSGYNIFLSGEAGTGKSFVLFNGGDLVIDFFNDVIEYGREVEPRE